MPKQRNTIARATRLRQCVPDAGPRGEAQEMKGTEGMTTIEPREAARRQAYEEGGLLAPWWHTALMVLLIIGLSVAGVRQLRNFGDKPLRLVANYSLTIATG